MSDDAAPESLLTIPLTGETALAAPLQEEVAAARGYADASRAPSTRRAYAADWADFLVWCDARGATPLPADPRVVAVFLATEAARGMAPMTIGCRLAAIGHAHRQNNHTPPQAREGAAVLLEVMPGIRRSHGKPPARKHAADADVLRDMLRAIVGDDMRSVRDRALLAFGMADAFRRSELVALRAEQLTREPRGMRVRFGRTKADQEGAGEVIAIPDGRHIRPVQLLEEWLARGYLGGVRVSKAEGRIRNDCTDERPRRGTRGAGARCRGGLRPDAVRGALAQGRVHHVRGARRRLRVQAQGGVTA